ncbi:hypothetical protein FACS189460_5730 [Deltaproteobacteria bacterium]|nr:hypothetical protein FACS189460_5730 [Deltaproteobacteria bacterium]
MAQPNSTVGLFNQALALLGGEQLSSVEAPWEQSTLGRLCLHNFSAVLDLALQAHDWSFALGRQILAEKSPGRYALPADCLRPVRISGGEHYTLEGQDLLTSANQGSRPLELLYVRRVEDPALWPPGFRAALAWGLAGMLATALWPPGFRAALAWGLAGMLATARNNDLQKQQLCLQQYQLNLTEAMARDNNSQKPEGEPSGWVLARNGQGRRN